MSPLRLIPLLVVLCACAAPQVQPRLHWQLARIDGAAVEAPVVLGLGSESYALRGPCTAVTGPFRREALTETTFGPAEIATSACPRTPIETAALSYLGQVRRLDVSVAGGGLTLTTAAGGRLEFRRIANAL